MNYEAYKAHCSKIADIGHAIAVLSWDKEVHLPEGAAAHRSQQIATLAGIAHEYATSDSYGAGLVQLNQNKELNPTEKRNVELSLLAYEKATKFEKAFVIRQSNLVSNCYHAWIKARAANNWEIYAPALDELIAIKREESSIYNKGDHPYDALVDIYEPDMNVERLDIIFQDVRSKLLPLIQEIRTKELADNSFLFQYFDKDAQWKFGIDILEQMGYDFKHGRQDLSTHPFTTSFSPSDVRITTRVDEHDFPMMLWSSIHEGGHALYEQGLPIEQYGLPCGSYISLGIHESQSRMWENNVGRSFDYWSFNYPKLQKVFPKQLGAISLNQFLAAINRIEPNLIRTEADELHYHFHVMIRYELEKQIMTGDISTNDLKSAWNAKYKEYLGIEPSSDNEGILQDIHWSHGSFGYFPTYSLGSFYAAQFYEQAQSDIDDLSGQLQGGDSSQLLAWLRDQVFQHGKFYSAEDLCKKITGSTLKFDPFMNYAKEKFCSAT